VIHEILFEGSQNALTGRQICHMLNLTYPQLKKQIVQERKEGHPICANTGGEHPGFFLAANKGEMQRYCRSLFHRAGELHRIRKACLKTLENLKE
jgi:hypothetical protein